MDLADLVHGLEPKNKPLNAPRTRNRSPQSHLRGDRGQSSGPSSARHSQHDMPNLRSSVSSSYVHPSNSKSKKEHSSSHFQRIDGIPTSNAGSSSSSPSPDVPTSHHGSSSRRPEVLVCELCNRTFESKAVFEQHSVVFHRRSKAPSKPREAAFPCPYCGKGFTSPSKRNVHQNATHMGLRPFQCDTCNKSFGYKGGTFCLWRPLSSRYNSR